MQVRFLVCGIVAIALVGAGPVQPVQPGTTGARSTQSIVVSKGVGGRPVRPRVAVDPGTGNVLVTWLSLDGNFTLYGAVLSRNGNGTYKVRKPRQLSGKGTNAESQEAIYNPAKKEFFVVFSEGGDTVGRPVKRKNGKPRGKVRTMLSGHLFPHATLDEADGKTLEVIALDGVSARLRVGPLASRGTANAKNYKTKATEGIDLSTVKDLANLTDTKIVKSVRLGVDTYAMLVTGTSNGKARGYLVKVGRDIGGGLVALLAREAAVGDRDTLTRTPAGNLALGFRDLDGHTSIDTFDPEDLSIVSTERDGFTGPDLLPMFLVAFAYAGDSRSGLSAETGALGETFVEPDGQVFAHLHDEETLAALGDPVELFDGGGDIEELVAAFLGDFGGNQPNWVTVSHQGFGSQVMANFDRVELPN